MKYDVEDDRFLRIFADIAKLIRDSEKAYDRAARSGNPDYAEFVGDSEADYLEELIGASFVVLQTKIRRVSVAAVRLQKFSSEQYGLSLTGFEYDAAVRKLGTRYKRTRATLVELIWDVGNYYKHRDEWPPEVWRTPRNGEGNGRVALARKTRRSVERTGIVAHSTGNLRTAYEFFGVEPYSSCANLAQAVQQWAEAVLKHARTQLEMQTRAPAS